MELDNLKTLWHDLDQKNDDRDSDEQILKILQKRSHSPIAKMKRNLQWELAAIIVFYSLPIFHFFTSSKTLYWELGLMLLLIGVCFVFYYYYKNKLLTQMQCVTCEVRSNLQKQLTTLEKYVRFYFFSGTILAPVAYFSTALLVWSKAPAGKRSPDTLEYTYLIGIGVLITIITYFVNVWILNKLYGQHIRKLKHLLQQMEEKEPIV